MSTLTLEPDFGATPADFLARIRATRSDRMVIDSDDDLDNPDIPQSPAWFRERNRAHAVTHVPPRYANATTDRSDVMQWVLNAALDPRNSPSLLLAGPTGTGKTHNAFAALRLYGESGRNVRLWVATSTAAFYGDLRPSGGRDTEKAFAAFAGTGLLLLDDLGATKNTEWTEEITYRLIDHRYNHCLPTIFTTNVRIGELAERLGDRTASRLAEMCQRIVLEGADKRRQVTA